MPCVKLMGWVDVYTGCRCECNQSHLLDLHFMGGDMVKEHQGAPDQVPGGTESVDW